jgi:hypothetical protein
MSFTSNKFLKTMGGAKPTSKDGLALPAGPQAQWKFISKDVKPGWYRDGFFFLFGQGVQRFERSRAQTAGLPYPPRRSPSAAMSTSRVATTSLERRKATASSRTS